MNRIRTVSTLAVRTLRVAGGCLGGSFAQLTSIGFTGGYQAQSSYFGWQQTR